MGRRTDHTREELKQMLIESAFDIVDQDGVDKFNARNITARIGYSVGTLYNLFESIEELTLYVNLTTITLLSDNIERAVSRLKSEETLGSAIAKHYLLFAKKHPGLWTLLFEKRIDLKAKWYEKRVEEAFSTLAGLIGQNEASVGKILWASLHGICLLKLRGKLGKENPEELCDELFKRFM